MPHNYIYYKNNIPKCSITDRNCFLEIVSLKQDRTLLHNIYSNHLFGNTFLAVKAIYKFREPGYYVTDSIQFKIFLLQLVI